MSIDLSSTIISSGCYFVQTFSDSVRGVSDSIARVVYPIFNKTTTHLSRLVSKQTHLVATDVFLETKRSQSALLHGKKGDVLIEITQDDHGLFVFKAVGDFFKPLIIKEEQKGVLWEVEVLNDLQKMVKNSESVTYGCVKSRWGEYKFLSLREIFAIQGLLREENGRVVLKLPEKSSISFKGPLAKSKAELLLKFYYQNRKTPMEENSGSWSQLFLGYLYFSGLALAGNHCYQKGVSDEQKAHSMALEGFLDHHQEGDFSLISQLEKTSFHSNGYTQRFEYDGKDYVTSHTFEENKETHKSTVIEPEGRFAEFMTEIDNEYLTYTEKRRINRKTHELKTWFKKEGNEWTLVREEKYDRERILDGRFASKFLLQTQKMVLNSASTFLATVLTKKTPKVVWLSALFQMAIQAESVKALSKIDSSIITRMRRKASSPPPIGLLNPSSLSPLFIQPGQLLNLPIDLLSTYVLADPSQNLDLTIQLSDGSPLPGWIRLGMGPITAGQKINLNGIASNLATSGQFVYLIVSQNAANNTLLKVDTRSQAIVWRQPVTIPSSGCNLLAQENAVFVCSLNGQNYEIQAFNATTSELQTTFNVGSYAQGFVVAASLVNNHILLSGLTESVYTSSVRNAPNNLTWIDVTNPSNPVIDNSIYVNQTTTLNIAGNVLYNIYFNYFNGIDLLNITSMKDMTKIGTITVFNNYYQYITCTAVKDQTLFMAINEEYIFVYNNADITNPEYLYSIFIGLGIQNIFVDGSFLYVETQSNLVLVIDLYDLPNAFITASAQFSTYGYNSAQVVLVGNQIIASNSFAGLSFMDASQRTLTITNPTAADYGLWLFDMVATDNNGNSLVIQLPVHVGNINVPKSQTRYSMWGTAQH